MDTFTFADPAWLWLLLLLPLAGWLKGATGTPPAVVYSSLSLVRQLQKIAPQKAGRLLWLLRWLALIVFILALARPQWGEGKQRIRASGIDIVVSMDLSDSMLAEDFQRFGRDANRLDVSKDVLEEFIKGRPSDRIGLIAFSGKAYIASPPTLNHAFLLENLDRFTTDTVPEEGTAIGSGISAAINRLREIKDSKSRIVILMTDGEENTGKIKGHEAATAAAAMGVKSTPSASAKMAPCFTCPTSSASNAPCNWWELMKIVCARLPTKPAANISVPRVLTPCAPCTKKLIYWKKLSAKNNASFNTTISSAPF